MAKAPPQVNEEEDDKEEDKASKEDEKDQNTKLPKGLFDDGDEDIETK